MWRVCGRLTAGVCQDLLGCRPRPQCLLCHRSPPECHKWEAGLHLWPTRPCNDRYCPGSIPISSLQDLLRKGGASPASMWKYCETWQKGNLDADEDTVHTPWTVRLACFKLLRDHYDFAVQELQQHCRKIAITHQAGLAKNPARVSFLESMRGALLKLRQA